MIDYYRKGVHDYMFFNKERDNKFALRKYKDGRTESKLIGATVMALALAVTNSPVFADVVTNNGGPLTPVSDTTKVSSDAGATFTADDQSGKTVKVDAVLESGTTAPTKANHSDGEADGSDTLTAKSKATINYKLESDKSILETKEKETGSTTIATPYDKKGIAYDADGKEYRESTVTKTGDTVSENTEKKDTLEVNGKVYEYVRSEVENADGLAYDKTTFNDIEASVSPEGLHSKLGEVDYTKTTGRVYLVEETTDGHYGKFVLAESGVSSDEDAAEKWRAGQSGAKDFTKENVTLQKGDTILVMDKDTYAVSTTTKHKRGKNSYEKTYAAVDVTAEKDENDMRDITYALSREDVASLLDIGEDGIFGTADDVEKRFDTNNPNDRRDVLTFDLSGREDKKSKLLPHTPDPDLTKISESDAFKDLYAAHYKIIDFLLSKAEKQSDIEALNQAKTKIDTKVASLVQLAKEKNLRMGLTNGKLSFYSLDDDTTIGSNDLTDIETEIRYGLDGILDALPSIEKHEPLSDATESELSANSINHNPDEPVRVRKEVTKRYYSEGGLNVSTITHFRRPDGSYQAWDEEEMESTENISMSGVPADPKAAVSISDDKRTVTLTKTERVFHDLDSTGVMPEDSTVTYTSNLENHEIITPVRAYKVMGDEKPVVNHYYNVKITEERKGEERTTKQGSVSVKHVTVDGKQLKVENVTENAVLETETTVDSYSGATKVDSRTETKTNVVTYDTADKQYPTLKDAETGFTYEYVGLKQGSPAANGNVVEGNTEVVYEYRLVSEEEKTPSKSEVKKTGSVDVKHATTDGKELKVEHVKENVPLEYEDTYVTSSNGVKVSERKDTRKVTETYDTADKQYPTLKDAETGFTYEYVGLKQGSSATNGNVVEGNTEVVYEYRLVSSEEKTPSKSEVKKTGSVDVKHVVVNLDGSEKLLKAAEVIKNNVPLEYEDTYVTSSNGVKISERKDTRKVTETYDTADKQYPTLKDETTGLVYKYVGVAPGSAQPSGDVTEGEHHVIYNYVLDKVEDSTPTVTETKGSVVVKYVDNNGNEIKNAENVLSDVVVKVTKTYTIKSGEVVLDSRIEKDEKNVSYDTSVHKLATINKDGHTYVLRGVLGVSEKYNNTTEENGKVKPGVATIVYEYVLQSKESERGVPGTPEVHEKPEYNGGAVPLDPPVVTIPEYDKPIGIPGTPEIYDKPEYNGGVNPINPPVLDIPEHKELIGGAIVPPEVHEKPEYNGGVVPLDPPVVTIPEYKEPIGVSGTPEIHEKPEYNIPEEQRKVEQPNKELPPVPQKQLPNTGDTSMFVSASGIVLMGIGALAKSKRKK